MAGHPRVTPTRAQVGKQKLDVTDLELFGVAVPDDGAVAAAGGAGAATRLLITPPRFGSGQRRPKFGLGATLERALATLARP